MYIHSTVKLTFLNLEDDTSILVKRIDDGFLFVLQSWNDLENIDIHFMTESPPLNLQTFLFINKCCCLNHTHLYKHSSRALVHEVKPDCNSTQIVIKNKLPQ